MPPSSSCTGTTSRVVPASGDTMAASCPASWFSKLLLPALGGPTMAIRTPLLRQGCTKDAAREAVREAVSGSWQEGHLVRHHHCHTCSRDHHAGGPCAMPEHSPACTQWRPPAAPDQLSTRGSCQVSLQLVLEIQYKRYHPSRYIVCYLLIFSKVNDSLQPSCGCREGSAGCMVQPSGQGRTCAP